MTLPLRPNSISLSQIQTEFGGTNPISISEYYRNTTGVPINSWSTLYAEGSTYTTINNTNVPSIINSTIKFSDFYGSLREILVVIYGNATNVDISGLFGGYWSQAVQKRVVINSGVVIGATSVSNYALNISVGLNGSLLIDNYGSIQGAGGLPNGGNGGNAILAGSSASINNQGSIYAGGGSGGNGGDGGTGVVSNQITVSGCGGRPGCPAGYADVGSFNGGCCQTYNYCCGLFDCGCTACSQVTQYRVCQQTYYVSGGTGGTGGLGQGYNQLNTAGSPGSLGTPPAGNGGAGGNGGTWGDNGQAGTSGSNGNYTAGTAGSPGGLAGFYIVNNNVINWTSLGSVAGRVG